ncbi:MAG: DMT family transporter [Rhizobiaceae bacterium]
MNALLVPMTAAFLGGVAIAVQASVNGALGRAAGDTLIATLISFLVGSLCLLVFVGLRGQFPTRTLLGTAPWWAWIGGALGAFYVWSAAWTVPRLGVLTLAAAVITGQLLASMLIDTSGAFGVPVHAVSWQRIVALLMVSGGLVLSRF